MKPSALKLLAYLSLLAFFSSLAACTPARYVTSEHGFYSTGYPGAAFSFAEDLTFATTGRVKGLVPADVLPKPPVHGLVAVYGDNGQGPVKKHAHVIYASLPSKMWEWAMESWAPTYAVGFSKKNEGGKYWTVQMMPVPSLNDWFSELWAENGREVPHFWLAKRWSATPSNNEVRILAEYREPAPECMMEALLPLEDRDSTVRGDEPSVSGYTPPDGMSLRSLCSREINEFSARADAAVLLDGTAEEPAAQGRSMFLPGSAMNIGKLIGEARRNERGNNRIVD